MRSDSDQLQLLSVFHFVVAGLIGLFSLIPVVHLLIGLGLVSGQFMDGDIDPPGLMIGWMFVIFAGGFITFGVGMALAIATAGRYLDQRSHYKFCFVVAAITCVFMPFGTILGVFTLIVLTRPSVKELFGEPVDEAVTVVETD